MSQEEIIQLNVKRVRLQLDEFFLKLKPEILNRCTNMVITDIKTNTKVTLDDIDFNKSCIFISNCNVLPFICIYALQKINKVLYPDTTLDGRYSRIRTDYMYAESNEVRYSKLDLSSIELESVPDMYKPTSYLFKKLIIWKFIKDVGSGDNENMYRFCNERLEERYYNNLMDWVFFIGKLEEFKKTYNTRLPYPTYVITFKRKAKTVVV